MKPRPPRSLRRKLRVLALSCGLFALGSTALVLGAHEWYSLREATVARLRSIAVLTARTSVDALAVSDLAHARQVLAALAVEPAVEAAVLYDQKGAPFATYHQESAAASDLRIPPAPPPDGTSLHHDHAQLVVPVADTGRRGTLLVEARIRTAGPGAGVYALLLLGSSLATGAVALLLGGRLARRIGEPVRALTDAAAAVQTGHDPLRPVPQPEDEELAALTDAFNSMLKRIGQNEAELRRAGDRLRLALDAGLIGTCEWDLGARRVFCDRRQHELLGLPAGRPVGEDDFYSALHPEDRVRARETIQQALRSVGDFSLEVRVPRADGATTHLLCRGRALADHGGAATRLVAVTTDLTERRRAELHVLENERRFRAVAEKTPALIWSCDGNLERDYFNATWLAFTGRDVASERRLGWQEGLPPEDRERWLETARAAAARLDPYTIEYRLRRADGAVRWLVEHASPRFRADDSFAGYLGSCFDITAGKENEAELEARVQSRTRQLEEVNRELESFSYSVSHDLRAPVRLINGYAEIALEDCLAGRAAEAATPIRSVLRSAARMNQLIDAFLSLARITRAELHHEEVDLSRLAADVVEVLRVSDRGREVTVRIAEGLRCRGDLTLLRILLENLLGNAWKFTAGKPGALIEVGADSRDGERFFFVRDDGVGFKEAFTDKLFQVFSRLHPATEFEGLGVGLHTVRRIVRRHEGRVWAHGAEGRGATFCFTLPE